MIPRLYILVGLSGSGKSSVAAELILNHQEENLHRVSSDEIRKLICPGGINDQSMNDEVFKIYHNTIRNHLRNGHGVIADATNLSIKSRRQIFNAIKGIECHKIAYVMTKTYEKCLKDNQNRDRQVPEEVIQRQRGKFQIPFYEEGFDEIILQNWSYEKHRLIVFRTDYTPELKLYKSIFDFDQKNPHHTLTLGQHMLTTYAKYFIKTFEEQQASLNNKANLTIAICMHDIGKLFTQTFDENGIAHYYGHANVGAYYFLTNYLFQYSEDSLLEILFYINYHMLPFNWDTPKAKRKWKKIFGEEKYNILLNIHEADKAAK